MIYSSSASNASSNVSQSKNSGKFTLRKSLEAEFILYFSIIYLLFCGVFVNFTLAINICYGYSLTQSQSVKTDLRSKIGCPTDIKCCVLLCIILYIIHNGRYFLNNRRDFFTAIFCCSKKRCSENKTGFVFLHTFSDDGLVYLPQTVETKFFQEVFTLNLAEILKHFDPDSTKPMKNGEYRTKCPAHNDEHPSLYIKENPENGNILLKCMAGCTTKDIVEAAGLEMNDLFPSPNTPSKYHMSCVSKPVTEGTYYYCDKKNTQIARKTKIRLPDGSKHYVWQRFENGNWKTGLNDINLPLYNLPSLINSTEEIYIVEGEKDADSMQNLGFVATSSPHGAGSKWDMGYNKYFKNRDVVIIADNDDAGIKHAKNIAVILCNVAKSVKVISAKNILPYIAEGGDISDIIEEYPENAKEMITDVVERADYYLSPETTVIKSIPSFCETNKYGDISVNAALLAEHFKKDKIYLAVKSEKLGTTTIYLYENGKYSPSSDDDIKSILIKYVTEYDLRILKIACIKEALEIIKTNSSCVLASEFNKDENIINFTNGLLHIDSMKLTPHTPDVLTTLQINAEWIEDDVETPVFDAFLDVLTNGDEKIIHLLTAIIGLCISCIPGYRTKKSLFLIGEGNTGKTRFKKLLEKLLGEEFCCALDLADLESRFGPSMLLGKRLAGSSDLSFSTAKQLKMFKQIVGGDTIVIEQKFKNMSSFCFDGFLVFASNTMPLFGGDKGDWVYERFIIVLCTNVIPEDKRDPFIDDRMFSERNGIVKKAVKALKKLIANNYKFDIPVACSDAIKNYQIKNSPAISFFEENCVMRKSDEVIS
ncbi:MAG: phage/plasmid primase, P4 family, partial [Acutalibacteraceae bacterium]|nr:phage/plasmid primase, P4 family [Acutalibacteraceae bacterium]